MRLKAAPLKPGDLITLVAPASPFNRAHLAEGISWLRSLGYRVQHRDDIFDQWRYLAGSDARRADELLTALHNPDVSAIVCARGGYGAARLLPWLEASPAPSRPVMFVGFSDITILHLFLSQRWNWVPVHGPMVGTVWMGEGLEAATSAAFRHLLESTSPPQPIQGTSTVVEGQAEGVVTGGNLSLLAHSMGTSVQADFRDAIVFLEDIHEAPYRVDRMLTQMLAAGAFAHCRGIVLGQFTDCDPPSDADFSLEDVLRERLEPLHVPVAAGFPIGHEEQNVSVPIGLRVRLDANAATLTFLEGATEVRPGGR